MIMVFAVIAGIVLIFAVLSYVTKRYNRMKRSEVANIIECFIDGKGSEWEWDDFISSPINDPSLDKIRIHCSQLKEEYPPSKAGEYTNEKGIENLKQYIKELKAW